MSQTAETEEEGAILIKKGNAFLTDLEQQSPSAPILFQTEHLRKGIELIKETRLYKGSMREEVQSVAKKAEERIAHFLEDYTRGIQDRVRHGRSLSLEDLMLEYSSLGKLMQDLRVSEHEFIADRAVRVSCERLYYTFDVVEKAYLLQY